MSGPCTPTGWMTGRPTHRSPGDWCIRTQMKTFTSMTELFVGPRQVRFLVHKELLVHHSRFFGAALSGAFVEGTRQSVKLPEEEVEEVEYFVQWLYTQRVDGSLFKDGKPKYYLLLHLYGLADRLCVEKLRNQIVDKVAELSEQTNSVPTPNDTCSLYEGIRDAAPLHTLVLDLFAFKQTDKLLASHPDDWHPAFLKDLCVKIKRPDSAALARHELEGWKPVAWSLSKACEVCRKVLKPQLSAKLCCACSRAFCHACVARGAGMCSTDWPGDCGASCKPWRRNMCGRYHEHLETAVCTDELGRGSHDYVL